MGVRAARDSGASLASLLLCLVPFQAPGPFGVEDLRVALRRTVPWESVSSVDLATRLAALGAPAVPALFGLASGKGMEELIGAEWVPEGWLCLPEEIPALSLTALGRAPARAVFQELERALAQEPTLRERIVVLRILEAHASAEGLALVFGSAREFDDPELGIQSVQPAQQEALLAILRQDPRSWDRVEQVLRQLEPEMSAVLAEAVGLSGKARGMDLLERILRLGAVDPGHLASCMARLEEARPWDLGGRTLELVAPWLRSMEASQRSLAARLVGRLRGIESVPALIELVGDADPQVRRCALAALEGMAGHALEPDLRALEAWLAREEAWKEARWSELHETVLRRTPGMAKEALRELARHPLYLHEAARSLAAELLEAQSSDLVLCAELQRIGSRMAVPGLLQAMEHGGSRLRAAAWRALRAITGEEHELAPRLWHAWIDP